MIKKMMLNNKDGFISFDEERKRGIFCFFSEGKTKKGFPYSSVRLHDVSRTEGSSSKKARFYWRRRRVTAYDKAHNDTVTNHVDIPPETIPELIKMLAVVYESITGGTLKGLTTAEMKADVMKKSADELEEDKLLKELGFNRSKK